MPVPTSVSGRHSAVHFDGSPLGRSIGGSNGITGRSGAGGAGGEGAHRMGWWCEWSSETRGIPSPETPCMDVHGALKPPPK